MNQKMNMVHSLTVIATRQIDVNRNVNHTLVANNVLTWSFGYVPFTYSVIFLCYVNRRRDKYQLHS